MFYDFVDCIGTLFFFRHIAFKGKDFYAQFLKFLFTEMKGIFICIKEADSGSLSSKFAGYGPSDTARSPRYHNDLVMTFGQ